MTGPTLISVEKVKDRKQEGSVILNDKNFHFHVALVDNEVLFLVTISSPLLYVSLHSLIIIFF